jgi:formylglycine-generating enzyme required for sulfatase activity
MGCVAPSLPKYVAAGEFVVGPSDWESEHVAFERGHVDGFWLDSLEVTWERFFRCIVAAKCALHTDPSGGYEPGQPVTNLDVTQARAFCAWAKGRLPRSGEWLRATAGVNSRRFPWGQTGLVCRRAAFGLVKGPCAEGGNGPEWSGSRPDGHSAEGLLDLVGNVAEVVEGDRGQVMVFGGSFRSDHASVLKSWSVEPYRGPRDDVGFRCAYDADPGLHSGD